jgi:hypothetical protein
MFARVVIFGKKTTIFLRQIYDNILIIKNFIYAPTPLLSKKKQHNFVFLRIFSK